MENERVQNKFELIAVELILSFIEESLLGKSSLNIYAYVPSLRNGNRTPR